MQTEAILPLMSATLTLTICLFAPSIASRLGLVDHPGGRKHHRKPTPLMGGVTLVSIVIPLWLVIAFWWEDANSKLIAAIALCTLATTLLAILDDRKHIRPSIRLAVSTLIFGTTIWMIPDLRIGVVNWNGNAGGLGLDGFASIITVLCLVTLANGINLSDGKNGLVLGISTGWLINLAIAAPPFLQPIVATLLGATIILLLFNLNGWLFLGDGGSYGIASATGLLSIYIYQHSPVLLSADQVGLMFMVPVGDMIRLMTKRWKRGDSPFTPDRDHLHHLLLGTFGWRRGLLLYLALVLAPWTLSLLIPAATLAIIALAFSLYWALVIYVHRLSQAPVNQRALDI